MLLLDHGADVNIQGGHYGSALQAAAVSGSQETVKLLLAHGADVKIQGGYYGSALQAAAVGGSQETVMLLLDHGADVNIQGGHYGSALQAAADEERQEIAKLLLKRGANVDIQGGYFGNALQAAAVSGSQETVKLLLAHGADVKIQGGYYGSALQGAAVGGSQEIVKLLLQHGADVNIQGGHYGSALQAAAYAGSQEIVKLLLRRGADENIQGGHYGSALQAAAYAGSQEIVKLLLRRGADVNIQGGYFGNALQAAAVGGSQETVKLLLDHGAHIQSSGSGKHGVPLLHAPVASQNWPLLQLLLTTAAAKHVNMPDILGRTPVHLAAINGDVNTLDMLYLCDSLDLNRGDIDGCTPLHCAVSNHAYRAVKWLVEHGANVDASDFSNTTPLQLAARLRSFRSICVILRKVTLTKMQVSDFHYALPQLGNCHILLSRDEQGANSIRILNFHESISYFNALSYPLEFSTSSLEERQVESVVTLLLQQAILFCKRSNSIDDSPVGVYWRWWRKMKKEERSSRPGEDKWIWKVQSNMMPSPGAVRQPPIEECSLGFLECRIVLPAYCAPLSLTQLSPIEIASSKHYIKWIMVKMTRGKPSSSPDNYDLKSKFFFSTFEYAEIPKSPLELFDHCLTQLGQEWDNICDAAETHLSTMRSMTFAAKGQNSNLIDVHLKDATTWAGLDTTQATQAKFLNELLRVYDPSRWPYLDGEHNVWSPAKRKAFKKRMDKTYAEIRKRVSRLARLSQEIIELEFNLTSIAEAQKSTSTNRSMKRLSWITFVFLPLMFIASLFGMNIDLLESNPAWWLYLIFATATAILTISAWIMFKRNPWLEDRLEKYFDLLFHKEILRDEEKAGWERRKRTMQFRRKSPRGNDFLPNLALATNESKKKQSVDGPCNFLNVDLRETLSHLSPPDPVAKIDFTSVAFLPLDWMKQIGSIIFSQNCIQDVDIVPIRDTLRRVDFSVQESLSSRFYRDC